jgi:amino acid adenylation domain-containing protein
MNKRVFEGYRLSPQQERLWHLCDNGDASAYRSQCAALIEGNINSQLFQAAVNRVISRHEILRTRLDSIEAMSLPLQVISEAAYAKVEEIDLAALTEREQIRELELLYERYSLARVDCIRGSALEVALARVSETRQVVLVSTDSMWSDRKGLKNVIKDVIREYEGAAGEDQEDAQYADVSEMFNTLIESNETKAGREYWERRAERNAGDVRLAVERARKGKFRPKAESRQVSDELSEKVKIICESVGAGEGAVLLSLFGVMVCRMGGEREVRVGVGYDGRTFDELKEAVGVYARYLPMDINMGEYADFSTLAKSVDEVAREYHKWQNYFDWKPFFASNGDGDKKDYFPHLFEYEAVEPTYSSGAIRCAVKRQYSYIDRFEVKLSCYRSGDGLTAEFHYDSAVYDPAEINELADHYMALLQSAAQEPRGSVDRLEILSSSQRERVLNEFNRTQRSYNTDRCVHELIHEQVERRPEAVAVVYGQREISYKELNSRANRLANYLKSRGLGPEQVVGVMVSRSVEMVVALLGVMKAGAAYLPLDADYPGQRLSYIMQDAKASLLLTEQSYANHLPEHNAEVIYIDTNRELIAQESDADLVTQVTSRNLVYVIYTSGSTGAPKGAMLTHAGIVNCLCWMQETYGLDATDRFLMRTSLNFDPSVWELFWPLWVGGTVILAEQQRRQDLDYLTELIEEREVTSAYFIPSMLRAFLDESRRGTCRSLKRVICGGESLSIETAYQFFDKLDAEFHHSYGPTETSIAATEWTCRRESKRQIAPIGKPLGNIQVYILDALMQPGPVGVRGELYIGGICVGRGYLNHADLTAERFAPDLFSVDPGARFYKTGDLARHLPDGEIEFCGRLDNQVKLRGVRIELGEIEAALLGFPRIRESAVVAREDERGEKRLVAYVVGEGEVNAGELREYLLGKLPEYMTPGAYVMLESLPLTPNGKLDRRALPEPESEASGLEAAAPRSTAEEMVAGIFADVLGLERVGIDESFFDLGGHSLLSTQVVSRVRSVFGVKIELRSLFEGPTVRKLAQQVESALQRGRIITSPAPRRIDRSQSIPLSFAQQRLWFNDQLEPGSALYNVSTAMLLDGHLDMATLERCLQEIVRRHEALRTSFSQGPEGPAQVISESCQIELQALDLSPLAADERMKVAKRMASEEARTGFDLGRGPLLRVKVLKLEEERHVALLTMHHIVSDGWSMGILIREVGALYRAYSAGERSPLEELPIQYADFAVWQREYLTGDVMEEEVGYWKERLKDAAELELPTDYARPAAPSYRGGRERVEIEKKLNDGLRKLSQRAGATLFMTLMAAFKTLLMRYSGEEDVSVGTAVANRTRKEVEGLIGFFVNTLVMRTDLKGNPSFRELIEREREVALGAYAHQEAPFEKLVEEINPERDLSRSPLFQVMMAMQNAGREELDLSGLKLSGIGGETGVAKFDLTLNLTEEGERIIGYLEYSQDLYEGETIRRMARHFEQVVGK